MTTPGKTEAETQTAWQADPFHTQVAFSAKHLGMMTVRGHFDDVSVTGHIHPDHPEALDIDVTVQTASIKTNHPKRDDDLRASNFLDVATYPTITFKSTKVESLGDNRYKLTGDLTIKGVTRPVTLDGIVLGEFNDPMMGHRVGYSAEGLINRKDFGMSFSMMLDGKYIVSDEVQISLEGEIVEQKQA
ncbi:MAG TPA: YceI family protein [Ktedonobacterales bacterium]|nr:YceI family protein [Ktedonobacterales bacterium]